VLATFAEVKEELGDATLVSYLLDGEILRALVVVDGSSTVVQLGAYAEAAESVLRLRADLDAQAGRALPSRLAESLRAATRNDAGRLGRVVLDPLLPWIGDRPLVVVPTGALVTVPWSALAAGAGRPITVAPSATTWYSARQRLRSEARPPIRRTGTGATSASGVVLGEPGRLPGVRADRVLLVAGPGNERGEAEVREIAGLHSDATVLTGDAATPAATLAGLGRASVVHLAAHGHHQAENALFSRLELAGGPLFGYDLQGIEPPGTVVLSSCDLGLADVRPGDETLGLSTALLAAGASTVIASVARVADHAAMEIMVRYHQNTLAGQTPAAALAAAVSPPDLAGGFICLGA
jgi:CHAT domain-containing protein